MLGLEAAQSYMESERRALDGSRRLLSQFESSDAKLTPMKCRATVERSETKRDEDAGALLLGRTALFIRGATPLQLAACILNAGDSRHRTRHLWTPAIVRWCNLEAVNAHHVVTFSRIKARGIADRTFISSTIVEKVSDDPLTYVVAVQPVPTHRLIAAED